MNVAFTLPPGAYATLVVKRLFYWTLEPLDARTSPGARARGGVTLPEAAPTRSAEPHPSALAPPALPPAEEKPASEPPKGFLARRRAEKEARRARREAARKQR